MADEEEQVEGEEEAPKKKGKKGLVIGLVLALVLGGGGFFAVYSGMILGSGETEEAAAEEEVIEPLEPVAFVPLEPIVVSLSPGARSKHLRFLAQLEVAPNYEGEVAKLVPRVMDVINSYLRAVDVKDLEDPLALISLRAQMLRRVQLVTGEGRVRDLLIMEFVLN